MRVFLSSYVAPQRKYLGWRAEAARLLGLRGLTPVDPIAGLDPANWDHAGLHDSSTLPSFLVASDLFKLEGSDAVLVRVFSDLPRQSIGTWFELAWAVRARKPVVIVTEDRTVAAHPFVKVFAAEVTETLEEGVEWIARLA